jgi:ubiquitin-protein ligase
MDELFKLIDDIPFEYILDKENKEINLNESLIKSTTLTKNKNIDNNTINILWNEIYRINDSNICLVIPIENNLLNLEVKFFPKNNSRLFNDFDNKKIKKEIIIKLKIPINYPNELHTITIKSPNFDNNLNYSIKFADYFKENLWNLTNTIEHTIMNVIDIIEKYGIISNKFTELKHILEKLSIITCISPTTYEHFNIDNVPIKKYNNSSTWVAGTGYSSYNDNKNWDIHNYLENEKKKNNKIINYLNKLLILEEIDTDIITNSCLIKYLKETLFGVQILDILENNDKFLIIFEIIKKFNFIINDEIITILCNLKNDFKKYIEILKKNNELLEIDKVRHLFSYLEDYNVKNIISNNDNDNDEYISKLQDLQFDTYPIYDKGLIKSKPHILNMRRILQEIQGLSKSLPINKDSSIFVKYDEENVGLFRFLIIGPKDTPYQDGCFLFEMILNNDYPNTPPNVHILTTGYGKVRFNPNLYASGKVCLSLLGTWTGNQGEQWNPKTSTLLQILVSIQSLIFTDKPYFNEPGYEKNMNTEEGKKINEEYNKTIQTYTKKWAIENMINDPPEDFKEIINIHFELKKIQI